MQPCKVATELHLAALMISGSKVECQEDLFIVKLREHIALPLLPHPPAHFLPLRQWHSNFFKPQPTSEN